MKKKTPPPQQQKNSKRTERLLLAGLLVLVFLVYAGSLKNGFILNWDDNGYVTENPHLKELSSENISFFFSEYYLSNYHPLTMVSLSIDYQLFGDSATGYHTINLLFHLFNVLLVFLLIRRLSNKFIPALFVAAFFGLHPMHVESVAWIAERKDVLYLCFLLLSFLAWLKVGESGKKWVWYAVSLALFILSCLSKSAAVVAPVLFVLADYYQSGKFTFRQIANKTPFFAVSVVFAVLAIGSQAGGGSIQDISEGFGWADRLLLVSHNLWFYLIKAMAPLHLSAFYFYPPTISFIHWLALAGIVVLITGIIRIKSGRKEIIFGSLFFLAALLPVLQIIPVGGAIAADRYTYLPYIGLFFIPGWILGRAEEKQYRPAIRQMLRYGSLILVLCFALLTYQRTAVWKDGKSLFTDVIQQYPDKGLGYLQRGISYAVTGNPNAALNDFNEALRLKPDLAEALYSRGLILSGMNDYQGALNDYNAALRYKPSYKDALNNRGGLYIRAGQFDAALSDFNKVLALDPGFTRAWYNRGVCYINMKKPDLACPDLMRAARLGHPDAAALMKKFCNNH